ncbi:MAG: acyltransferase [Anaerolineae bacterium]|jgi:galactoside O-acetyltransferase|nr:acyltransferase [Anaerolineae bacterium]
MYTDNQADKIKFLHAGEDVYIWPMAKIVMPEVISLGDSVKIDDYAFVVGGLKTTIGSFVHIASFASVTGGGEFTMHDFAAISSGVRIFTGNEDYSGATMTNPTVPHPYRVPTRGFVTIEKHAIVGANSVVLPGVVIGEGAVIMPNSVITQNCAPWRLYAGYPLRPVSVRPSETILQLEQQLRAEVYRADGSYIPARQRPITGE